MPRPRGWTRIYVQGKALQEKAAIQRYSKITTALRSVSLLKAGLKQNLIFDVKLTQTSTSTSTHTM